MLTAPLAEHLAALARAAAPREACGVLVGRPAGETPGPGEDGLWRIVRIVPVANVADAPTAHFYLDEAQLVAAWYAAEAEGAAVLGFYHSHPAGPPVPSPADVATATYPDLAMLIIGLQPAPALAAWRIGAGEAVRLPLIIDDGELFIAPQPPPLPAAQAAIVIAALAAAVLAITLALTLLPPAPPIPGR